MRTAASATRSGPILRDRDHRWIYLASVLGGGGRGLGVVNLFALLYLTSVIGLTSPTTDVMYGALIVLSVPMPLVAGWLSDRVGRRPVIIGVYVGGAIAFAAFLLAGSSLAGLWLGILLMGLFSFAESPQLQALLADIAPPTDPRRLVRPVLHPRVRGRVAVDRRLRGDHRPRRRGCRAADRVRPDGRVVRGRRPRGHPDPRAARRLGSAVPVAE